MANNAKNANNANSANGANNANDAKKAQGGKVSAAQSTEKTPKQSHVAGAFDIRNVIGLLMGLYGLVLLISYFLLDPGTDVTTGESKNEVYNLVCGIGMLVVAAVFIAWTKLDPIKIDEATLAKIEAEQEQVEQGRQTGAPQGQ